MEVINSNEESAGESYADTKNGGHARSVVKQVLAVCLIVLLLAGIIFLVGFIYKPNPVILENKQDDAVTTNNKQDDATSSLSIFFDDCKPLQENCTSGTDCISASICGEGIYETCEIYDCGDTYGVYTKSGGGSVNTYKQAKADKNITQSEPKVCKALTVETLQQKCVDNKMQLKVKLTTEGECKISDFIILYDSKENQPNTFVSLGDNVYLIEVETCGGLTDITPRTEGGIPIL